MRFLSTLWIGCWLILVTAFTPPAAAQSASGQTLTFGVFPYVTPVQLAKFHNPLRARLEEVTGHPVTLVTAPTFSEFIARTRAGVYNYVLTAPHLARLAEYRDGYIPLIKTGHVVRGVYLVPKDSPIRTLADIRGHSIMMVGKAAIITQMVIHQLAELGLHDGVNMEIRNTRTHNNAMYASLRGESDVSVTGVLLFERIGHNERKRVRVIGETPSVPGFILLARGDTPEQQYLAVKESLQNFTDTPAGKAYLQPTGFQALLPVEESEMKALQPFIQRFLDADK